MYKLSVPFLPEQIENYGVEPFIDNLKKIGADYVFLGLGTLIVDPQKHEKLISLLNEYVPRLQSAGFKVGLWIWAFMIPEENNYTHITSPNGKVSAEEVCPSDEEFCSFAYERIRALAGTKPDMIMFDDDFRYGFIDCGLGCTCKNHRKYMSEVLGEEIPEKDLGRLIFGGGRNKYRSAYLKANGYYFRRFAKLSRDAVDSVDSNIRLGPCACMSTWDFDGVSAAELSRIMAGNTKPFLRLIGAPYWSYLRGWGNRLQDVIELERMESSWCDDDIELLAEGDCYPRPRFTCSANQLEGFDMALRASGCLDGIHKYVFDYLADPDYEPGYVRKHLENVPLYNAIDRCFDGKTPVGVRVWEHMTKFEDMRVPYYYDGKDDVQNAFFSPAARMLAAHAIPSVYDGLGTVGIAFGENAKYLEPSALDGGLILDVTAAQILEDSGVDVGLASVGDAFNSPREYFVEKKRYVHAFNCPARKISVKHGVKVESKFFDGENEYVGSYSYENKKGQKFLVFAFEGYNMSEHAFKQYARGEQIVNAIAEMGKRLPAQMLGNPDCYMLCKDGQDSRAVFIGNFFSDECMNTTVTLDGEYKTVEFINCTGKLKGNLVMIDRINPYDSVGFEVKR